MARWCSQCGRKAHKGLCDLVVIGDPSKGTVRTVHAKRVDEGDLKQKIEDKNVVILNRFIKKEREPAKPKKKARKS